MEKPQFNHPEFLDKKYPDLAGSKPVERATEIAGEKGDTPHTREERVEAYLNRLESVWNAKNEKGEDRGFELLKNKIINEFVTDFDEIPESYWKLQETILRERGQLGDWQKASEEEKKKIRMQDVGGFLADQKSSLEQWLDYFHLPDSNYIPKELKYWILRNITKLSEFDKEKKEFPKRSKGTVKQFPDINYEALGYLIDAIKGKYEGKNIDWNHDIQPEERRAFEGYLTKEDFAKLYAWANELMNPIPEHLLPIKEGEWRKFDQGSDSTELTKTIRGKGTGWCTAGEQTAKSQLSDGDFYVFYSKDDNGEAVIPRIAIRMEKGKIAEVRGIAFKQNLDPFMGDVLKEKLNEFPDKDEYLKKEKDMRMLTEIEKKNKTNAQLSKEELEFLYEQNGTIEGFGYQKDPRIEEIRKQRNIKEDLPIIFDCEKTQIATNVNEVNENTKIYVGKFEDGIFEKFSSNISQIYESFPGKKILPIKLVTDSLIQSPKQAEAKLMKENVLFDHAEDLLYKTEFSKEIKEYNIIILSVKQIGFSGAAAVENIYAKAKKMGLKLCPAEVGPQLRLNYVKQPKNEMLAIAMEAIPDNLGVPRLFYLGNNGSVLFFGDYYGSGASSYDPSDLFAFTF